MLGLPADVRGCLFDLDGVLTQTAKVHGLGNRKNEIFTRLAGDFGFVVGVDRVGQAGALKEHGADIVVTDLAELMENQ